MMFRNHLIRAFIAILLLLTTRAARAAVSEEADIWVGTYRAKDVSNNSAVVKKFTLSKGKNGKYFAKIELSHLLSDESRKLITLVGEGEFFGPADDKNAGERLFVFFRQKNAGSFLEIYPGQKSSPNNHKGFLSLHYLYFERSQWNSYVRSELIRTSATGRR